jgi:hypothetical protein
MATHCVMTLKATPLSRSGLATCPTFTTLGSPAEYDHTAKPCAAANPAIAYSL